MSVFTFVVMMVGIVMVAAGIPLLLAMAEEHSDMLFWATLSYALTIVGMYLVYETVVIA